MLRCPTRRPFLHLARREWKGGRSKGTTIPPSSLGTLGTLGTGCNEAIGRWQWSMSMGIESYIAARLVGRSTSSVAIPLFPKTIFLPRHPRSHCFVQDTIQLTSCFTCDRSNFPSTSDNSNLLQKRRRRGIRAVILLGGKNSINFCERRRSFGNEVGEKSTNNPVRRPSNCQPDPNPQTLTSSPRTKPTNHLTTLIFQVDRTKREGRRKK